MREAKIFARQSFIAAGLGAVILLTSEASAQEGDASEAQKPADGNQEEATRSESTDNSDDSSSSAATDQADESPPGASEPGSAADDSSPDLAAELAALKAEVAELKTKQEEAELNALAEEPVEVSQPLFKVYGFMDMGLQKFWVNEKSLVAALFDTNAASFVTGNIDLYFDFNPDPDWRALAEIRFTGAPQGAIENFGGLGGDFKRTNTQQYDPNGSTVNAPVWGGYTVIERAWIEWNRYQQLQVRTGHFFTPFGIWNVDHGQPTLISVVLPQFIQQTFLPLRQTGVQALGSFFVGDWELAYRAWLSNGRTETNWLDFTDDKAFGARAFVRNDTGKVRAQVGGSYHHGKVENKVVDITGVPPTTESVEFRSYSTEAYTEDIFGADISLDIVDTRIRAEYIGQLRRYEEGKRPANGIESNLPGTYVADGWRQAGYVIVAQQLPWWGLEPYLYGEVMRQDWALAGDGLAQGSIGLNIHFTPSASLKTQYLQSWFFKWKQPETYPGDANLNNVKSLTSRLVLAF